MKDNFQTNIKCRLINPRKTEMDQVMILLDGINNAIRIKTCVKQWRNTTSMLESFNNLSEKNKLTFQICYIVEFYPSVS